MAATLVIGVGISAIAEAKPNGTARLWLADVQTAEEMISAAVVTTDPDELKKQSYALAKLQGRVATDLVSVNEDQRVACAFAVQNLANVVHSLAMPPAKALKFATYDAGEYRKFMALCEKAFGARGKRHLPF